MYDTFSLFGGTLEGNVTVSNGTLDVSGDITGSTLNADGDTAAGDNAAIGYTSAEGLILTGQGSTSDITLKNDADALNEFYRQFPRTESHAFRDESKNSIFNLD